jgi:hypothetical protein
MYITLPPSNLSSTAGRLQLLFLDENAPLYAPEKHIPSLIGLGLGHHTLETGPFCDGRRGVWRYGVVLHMALRLPVTCRSTYLHMFHGLFHDSNLVEVRLGNDLLLRTDRTHDATKSNKFSDE